MSQIIQTLVTELTANGAQMRTELQNTLQAANTWGSRIGGVATAVGVGLAAAATGAAVALSAMVMSQMDAADSLYKQSQIVAVNVEDLAKLKHASEEAGVEFESLGSGLKKFSKNIIDAADGSREQADAFKRLGINLRNNDGTLKNTNTLFTEVAESMSRYKDSADKTVLAQTLFGKAGADLIPLLNSGKQGLKDAGDEAERFGLVMSESSAKSAEQFNDNLSRLNKSLVGISTQITVKVAPSLAELTDTFSDPEFQQGITNSATSIIDLGVALGSVFSEFVKFGNFLGEEFARTINGVADDDIPGLEKRLTELQAAVDPKNLSDWMNNSNMGDMFTGKGKLLQEIEDIKRKIAVAYASTPPVETPKAEEAPKAKMDLSLGREAIEQEKKWADEKKKLLKENEEQFWQSMKLEDERIKREEDRKKEDARLIESEKRKFDQIYELSLQADNKNKELENFRYERLKGELKAEVELFRQRGLLTEEVEAQFQAAREQQKQTHELQLKKIDDDAEKARAEKQQTQLSNTQQLFGSLADLVGTFAGKNSRAYKAMFAIEKGIAVARAIVAIQAGIAMASANPFPANLAAMASVATSTAGLVSTIKGTKNPIAHGGLDYVPKEETYLLDKGERVLSPRQNKDLTDFVARGGGARGVNVVVHNYGNEKVDVRQDGNKIDIFVGQVVDKINDQIVRGNGIATTLQNTYSLTRRGVV